MNEPGILAAHTRKIKSRAARRVERAAINQHIAIREQPCELFRGGRVGFIEHNTRLARIQESEPGAMSRRCQRRIGAKRVTARRLDLGHDGAEVREHSRAIARRSRAADLDDSQMGERGHPVPPDLLVRLTMPMRRARAKRESYKAAVRGDECRNCRALSQLSEANPEEKTRETTFDSCRDRWNRAFNRSRGQGLHQRCNHRRNRWPLRRSWQNRRGCGLRHRPA